MSQADTSNSTDTSAEPLSGLALQQQQRETTLRNLATLRKQARDEIDRLIAFLDVSDEYAMTELEDQVDDGPCDCNELEISEGDDEPDGDGEPSLAAPETDTGSQHSWAAGGRDDREDGD